MFRDHRIALGISQSKLARLSGVSRFKICTYELGDTTLTADEQNRIQEAFRTEASRLRNISIRIESSKPGLVPAKAVER